jgi:hypothetical protein
MHFRLGGNTTFADVRSVKSACLLAALTFLVIAPASHAVVDDSQSFALEAAAPYVEKGFTVREEHWSGTIPTNKKSTITQQLFKGNEYWFWLASDVGKAVLNIHVYDAKGNLVDEEAWAKGNKAGVRIVPKSSGTYYVVFIVESSPEKRTRWSIAYGFK